MEKIQIAVPTLFGVESVAATELRRLGLQEVHADTGRVYALAELADIPRANLNLRTGERVQIFLGSFAAHSFDDLFEGVKALPWENFIPKDGAFPVKGHCLDSQLSSEPACQSIVKKAVAERLGKVYGCQQLPEDGSLYQIQFALLRDQVTMLLDTSGPGLYKRGYREPGVIAPLRETLAAALVLLSRYHGQDHFCDPCCGSGTIPIEAAMIARNRAPGLDRNFAAQRWLWLPGELWSQAAEEALDKEYQGEYHIWGGDIDYHAIQVAQRNAARAEVDDVVHFEVADARNFHRRAPAGRLVLNPPYGERLLDREETALLYQGLATAVERLASGWQVHILTAYPDFELCWGRSADKRRKLYNGMLKFQFYSYLGDAAPKDKPKDSLREPYSHVKRQPGSEKERTAYPEKKQFGSEKERSNYSGKK